MRRTIASLTLLLMAAFGAFAEQPLLAETVSPTATAEPEDAADSPAAEDAAESSAAEGAADSGAPEFDIDVHVILSDDEVSKIDRSLRINKLHSRRQPRYQRQSE